MTSSSNSNTEHVTEHVTEHDIQVNIEKVLSHVTEQEKLASKLFYLEANRFVSWLSAISGLTLKQVAAVVAVTSPRNEWSQNQLDAIALCIAGYSTKTGYTALTRDLLKADKIINLSDSDTNLDSQIYKYLSGRKVCAFYENIIKPNNKYNSLPIDRHILRCVSGRLYTPAKVEEHLLLKLISTEKRYLHLEHCLIAIAKKKKQIPIVLVNQLWYTCRRLRLQHSASEQYGQSTMSTPIKLAHDSEWKPTYPGTDAKPILLENNVISRNYLPKLTLIGGSTIERPWLHELPFKSARFGNETLSYKGRVIVRLYPGHKFANGAGWQYRYRLQVCYAIGRLPRTDEHVHHIDNNKLNDRLDNLELVLVQSHGVKHYTLAKLAGKVCDRTGRFLKFVEFDNLDVPF